MSGLVDFIKARLDEDEQLAKAATAGPWRVANVTDCGSATVDGPDALQNGGYDTTIRTHRKVMRPQEVILQDVDYGPTVELADATHIARHDPARVLREVGGKRRLIEDYERGVTFSDGTLRIIASVYADHPDYREEWRP